MGHVLFGQTENGHFLPSDLLPTGELPDFLQAHHYVYVVVRTNLWLSV